MFPTQTIQAWNISWAVKMQVDANESRVGRSLITKYQQQQVHGVRDAATASMSQSASGAAAREKNGRALGGPPSGSRGRGGGRPRGGGPSARGGRGGGVGWATSKQSRAPPAGSRSAMVSPPSRSQDSVASSGGQQRTGSSGNGGDDVFDLASEDGESGWSGASAEGGGDADAGNAAQTEAFDAKATASPGTKICNVKKSLIDLPQDLSLPEFGANFGIFTNGFPSQPV